MGALGTSALSPTPPFSASGRPPGSLPPQGRGSRGMSCLQRVYEVHPLLHSQTCFFPARYLPCFLLGCQQHIILSPSTTRAPTTTARACISTVNIKKKKNRQCPRVVVASLEASLDKVAEPTFLHGAQDSWRRERAVFYSSIYSSTCSFQ